MSAICYESSQLIIQIIQFHNTSNPNQSTTGYMSMVGWKRPEWGKKKRTRMYTYNQDRENCISVGNNGQGMLISTPVEATYWSLGGSRMQASNRWSVGDDRVLPHQIQGG